MRRLRIRHVTRYSYAEPARFHPHRLLVRPREGHDVRVESSRLAIQPAHSVVWHRDINDNSVAVVEFQEDGTFLEFDSEVVIEHYEAQRFDYPLELQAQSYPFKYHSRERIELAAYQQLLSSEDSDVLNGWIERFWTPGSLCPTMELLDAMNGAIPADFQYVRREEPGVQRAAATLSSRAGSCRDFATFFIEVCRHLGFAARFVSGYLYAPTFAAADGATHAWAEIYLPGAGWRGFDSTIGSRVGQDHIAVAVARHPETVPPVAGTFDGGPANMEVNVEVVEL